MIRTITLNSGFDHIFTVAGMTPGGVGEAIDHAELVAGKGINAARMVRALGYPVVAYSLVGAADRSTFEKALVAEGIEPVLVEVPGRTRRNLTLVSVSDHQPAAHFRAHGFDLEGTSAVSRLTELVAAQVRPGDVVTINGSVPLGAGSGTWVVLAEVVVRAQAELIVDVYGQDLPKVLDAVGTGVLACKPNAIEIDDLPGVTSAQGDGRCAAALRFMANHGVRLPIVTLGAEGALFASDGGIWSARCPVGAARVSVGAGDAFAGALAAGVTGGLEAARDLVEFASAVAAAYVESIPGPHLQAEQGAIRKRVTIERLADL